MGRDLHLPPGVVRIAVILRKLQLHHDGVIDIVSHKALVEALQKAGIPHSDGIDAGTGLLNAVDAQTQLQRHGVSPFHDRAARVPQGGVADAGIVPELQVLRQVVVIGLPHQFHGLLPGGRCTRRAAAAAEQQHHPKQQSRQFPCHALSLPARRRSCFSGDDFCVQHRESHALLQFRKLLAFNLRVLVLLVRC